MLTWAQENALLRVLLGQKPGGALATVGILEGKGYLDRHHQLTSEGSRVARDLAKRVANTNVQAMSPEDRVRARQILHKIQSNEARGFLDVRLPAGWLVPRGQTWTLTILGTYALQELDGLA